MKEAKDKWIDQVLTSADNAARGTSATLVDRVMMRMSARTNGKDAWVEQTLGSIDGIGRAIAPEMTEAILSKIGASQTYSIPRANSSMLGWRIAASVMLLLILNSVAIYSQMSKMEKHEEMQEAAAIFGLGQDNHSADPGTAFFGN